MPARQRKPSAPAARVYKSAQPLQQAKFPPRSTRVRGYGSAGGRKIPKLQKQDTLTQMDFVKMAEREFEEESHDSEAEDDEGGGVLLEGIEDGTNIGTEEEVLDSNMTEALPEPTRALRRTRKSADTSDKLEQERLFKSLDQDRAEIEGNSKSAKYKNKRRRTLDDQNSDSNEDEYQGNGRKKTKSEKKAKGSRRKTLGDQPSTRKKLSKPQFHTQTITQLDWGMLPPREDLENDAVSENEEFETDIFDVPNSSQILKASRTAAGSTKRQARAQSPDLGSIAQLQDHNLQDDGQEAIDHPLDDNPSSPQALPAPRRSTRVSSKSVSPQKRVLKEPSKVTTGIMGPPQTPKRIRKQEIPSSESPATPNFLRSGASQGRNPLEELTANTPIPFNPGAKGKSAANPGNVAKLVIEDTFDTGTDVSQMQPLSDRPHESPYALPQLPKMVVEDTFELGTDVSQMQRLPSTPSKKSSPPKSVRFAIPEAEASSPVTGKTQKSVAFAKSVIYDSDDSDDDYVEESQVDESQEVEGPLPESFYGEFGDETQFEADQLASTATSSRVANSQTSDIIAHQKDEMHHSGSSKYTQPTQIIGQPSYSSRYLEADDEDGQGSHYEEKTQFRESQRLHTQHVNTLAPRTLTSDVFVTIASAQMTDIVSRARTHDIRAYALPISTVRLWYYVAKPICKLTYMAVVGPGKRPGDIDDADEGVGSKAFNKKGQSWRAYEVEELYELADPLTMDQLKEFEWLKAPPKRFERVRPAVINHFIANLMPPIFSKHDYVSNESSEGNNPSQAEDSNMQHTISSSLNDTQDATEQLLSTMKQFTQFDTPTQPVPGSESSMSQDPDRVPSSQDELMLPPPFARSAPSHPGLSQATTVDLTQTQHHTSINTPRKSRLAAERAEIVWESPTRPVRSNSTTPARLPVGQRGSSDALMMMGEESMVVPLSIPSSQMLTRSQMQDDVVFDSIPAPPRDFLGGSDQEDEIEDDF